MLVMSSKNLQTLEVFKPSAFGGLCAFDWKMKCLSPLFASLSHWM